jgi:hypothetical protein
MATTSTKKRINDSAVKILLFMRLLQQIRTIFFRAVERLFSPPLCDLSVISREQDFRDLPAAKLGRPRVLRRLEEASAKAIVRRGLLVAECARQQTNNCINQNNCGDRAVGQHIVANRNLEIDQMFDHAVIDSFVMAAENDEMRFLRKLRRQLLV